MRWPDDQRDAATLIGAAVSGVWLLMVLAFWLLGPEGAPQSGLARLATLIGVALPLVLIWLAVGLARAIATLRDEAAELRLQLATRGPGGATPAGAAVVPARPAMQPVPVQQPAPRSAPASTAAAAPAPRPAPPADSRQASMSLQPPQPETSVSPRQLVLALNFPDGPEDRAAIAALRLALRDPDHARLLRAAQDVVTLLAGRGIFMDDLPTDTSEPALWRRFAAGERGGDILSLAAIDDDLAQDEIAAMLRNDEIFRDTAHHFLRHFDRMLTRIAPELDDPALAALTGTRSARAFMLLGRQVAIFGRQD
ncbi:MAG: hypothetical protein Q4G24_01070 [Paracoccus sp. (in: a-proteobacteria)]|uniref:hypothetical protein n=1 Tax=Paracoccus sp. TaxID=267 RepID=UPI0026E042A5|nr:hypothetical protein [Paracoccus sp. (in: a-proteobacteria)]MDO5620040.1 hypothetical protein [Paracoccus sp. (in: a-proteobacteria)]